MKHLKTYEAINRDKKIVYTFNTKAKTNGGNEYNVHLLQGDPKYDETNGYSYNGLVISIDNTPGSWYVSTFLHYTADNYSNIIHISGDDWICTNRLDIVSELRYWINNFYQVWKDSDKYNL